ncbi:hypothetical protein GOBAR_AA34534 [Gossypium barbadense]|uniref:VQ domain-containing protein n=1 Tax=Gossypium barbadense TaxID=3634 RepID=A0A2P5W4X9_GOSBA|nr:hypothetical protein GOBAR_AA34534 [Gossypium barbadense]
MGKKVIHQLTSKNVDRQLHSVIKGLKPKVYITDSSSFKHLVQELTGYRTQTVPIPDDVAKVIEIEKRGEMFPDFTTTLSTDSSLDSSFDLYDDQTFHLDDINQLTGLLQTDDHDMFDEMSNLSTNHQQMDWLGCRNLESRLLDDQEGSLFDYELLSGSNALVFSSKHVQMYTK